MTRGALARTSVFVRMFLRRDRWMILWFTLGIALLYWSQAASVRGLYRTQAEFDRAAASMEHNTAFIAMAGPPRALNTAGGQVTWQASAFGAIAIGLMVMFLIGRHTRAEEESGRDELVRSAPVGRHAPMTAALLVAGLASVVVGAAVALSLMAYRLPAAGAWANGLGVALCGLVFATIALLAAQLTSSTRAAYGITGATLGVCYALRAIGDAGNGALSWVSPIGWYQAMHPFSGERWWPALLLLALAVVFTAIGYAVFERRDVGAGIWPSRPGPARASHRLGSALGLSWRLQRGSVRGWAAGLFLGGIAYGTIGKDVKSLVGDSQFAQDVFGSAGVDVVDSFYATAALMLALIASGFTISSALRPRGEEEGDRVEALLATALPRRQWLFSQLIVTALGAAGILVLGGIGLGLGYALVTGDQGKVGTFTWAAASLLPAVFLLGGLAALLYGVLPRLTVLSWLALIFCVVVMLFGEVLRFPTWLQAVSPFHHLASVPAASTDWPAFGVVLAAAVALGAGGLLGFIRRDVR